MTVDVSASLVDKANRAKIKRLFDAVHEQRYGTSAPKEAAEIVGLRVTVIGTMRRPPLERIARGGPRPPATASRGKRKVHFAELGRFVDTPTFQRGALKAGNRLAGPALDRGARVDHRPAAGRPAPRRRIRQSSHRGRREGRQMTARAKKRRPKRSAPLDPAVPARRARRQGVRRPGPDGDRPQRRDRRHGRHEDQPHADGL